MIRFPSIHQTVELRYAAKRRAGMPHGQRGTVLAVKRLGRGPRNHLILVAGVAVVVPAGNLFPAEPAEHHA